MDRNETTRIIAVYDGSEAVWHRLGQIKFLERKNPPILVNGSIGNVMRPMHPAMQRRLFDLGGVNSPFHNGIVPYVPTTGTDECREAFLHICAAKALIQQGLMYL